MKNQLALTIACLATALMASCDTQTKVDPAPDQRNQHVGLYACEVKIENYATKQILSSYLDTLELSKQGQKELVVKSLRKTPIPVLQVNPPYAYYGLLTNLRVLRDTLSLTSGPDAKFYVYTGYKLK